MPTVIRLLEQVGIAHLGKEVWKVSKIEVEEVTGKDKVGRMVVEGTLLYPQARETRTDRKGQ